MARTMAVAASVTKASTMPMNMTADQTPGHFFPRGLFWYVDDDGSCHLAFLFGLWFGDRSVLPTLAWLWRDLATEWLALGLACLDRRTPPKPGGGPWREPGGPGRGRLGARVPGRRLRLACGCLGVGPDPFGLAPPGASAPTGFSHRGRAPLARVLVLDLRQPRLADPVLPRPVQAHQT